MKTSLSFILKWYESILKQESIPVGCVRYPAVAVSPATHAPLPCTPPATHAPCHTCPRPHMPPCHAPHCEQNQRCMWKHNPAATTLRTVMIWINGFTSWMLRYEVYFHKSYVLSTHIGTCRRCNFRSNCSGTDRSLREHRFRSCTCCSFHTRSHQELKMVSTLRVHLNWLKGNAKRRYSRWDPKKWFWKKVFGSSILVSYKNSVN